MLNKHNKILLYFITFGELKQKSLNEKQQNLDVNTLKLYLQVTTLFLLTTMGKIHLTCIVTHFCKL